jgi:hypothetical protein
MKGDVYSMYWDVEPKSHAQQRKSEGMHRFRPFRQHFSNEVLVSIEKIEHSFFSYCNTTKASK